MKTEYLFVVFPFTVLKVLQTVMEKAAASEATGVDPSHNEFFNTGRVGRRNAMPDILGQHCRTTTADLPDQLSALSTQDGPVLAVTDSDGGGATAEATACFTVTTDTATTSSTMQKADDSSNS